MGIFYWLGASLRRVPPPLPRPLDRNDTRQKRFTAEMTHQNRPNRLTPKFGQNNSGRIDPAETTHSQNDPDSLIKHGPPCLKCDALPCPIKASLHVQQGHTRGHKLSSTTDLYLYNERRRVKKEKECQYR